MTHDSHQSSVRDECSKLWPRLCTALWWSDESRATTLRLHEGDGDHAKGVGHFGVVALVSLQNLGQVGRDAGSRCGVYESGAGIEPGLGRIDRRTPGSIQECGSIQA